MLSFTQQKVLENEDNLPPIKERSKKNEIIMEYNE